MVLLSLRNLKLCSGSGVESLRAVAQIVLASIIHTVYKDGNTTSLEPCHDGTTDRNSAEDLLSSYEP
jgi:hypothetical protein